MLKNAKKRARLYNIPCTITIEDIVMPEVCPITKQKFERGHNTALPASPSLDKIIPELGYVPGNIAVISHKANAMKQDCSPEELRECCINMLNWLDDLEQSKSQRFS